MSRNETRSLRWLLIVLCGLSMVALPGCPVRFVQWMANQPRVKPLGPSDFFSDGRGSRPAVPGAVARGQLRLDSHLEEGKVGGKLVTTFPFPVTRQVLERGRERFNVYCAPCHDRAGTGDGMVVRRGFRRPPTFHSERLRSELPVGHLFDVETNGFGAMPDYSFQLAPRDRWAVVSYLRALQLSQNARPEDVSPDVLRSLTAQRPSP